MRKNAIFFTGVYSVKVDRYKTIISIAVLVSKHNYLQCPMLKMEKKADFFKIIISVIKNIINPEVS